MWTSPSQLTNEALLGEVKRLAQCERSTIATLVAHLVEVEKRGLHHAEGYSSMCDYCTEALHLSEHAAFLRLRAARAASRHPEILEDLARGALHLCTIQLIEPHLTRANYEQLIDAARHKSKREVERLVRAWYPLPDVPSSIRKLPARTLETMSNAGVRRSVTVGHAGGAVNALPASPAADAAGAMSAVTAIAVFAEDPLDAPVQTDLRRSDIAPLSPERYKVQFTASEAMHKNLRQAQDLLRHRIPDGDVARVFEIALQVLLEKLERQKLAATDRPRKSRGVSSGSRAIPAEVKRAVWNRDDGRCAFVAESGRRCKETAFLEFHHIVPFARGGQAVLDNIALRCRAHNQYEVRLECGLRDMPLRRREHAAIGRPIGRPDPVLVNKRLELSGLGFERRETGDC